MRHIPFAKSVGFYTHVVQVMFLFESLHLQYTGKEKSNDWHKIKIQNTWETLDTPCCHKSLSAMEI